MNQNKTPLESQIFFSYHPRRVSYILVTKNRAPFLDQTLNHCRKLVTAEDELIVIDGASTDATKEVVKNYRDIINIFVSESDSGGVEAFNKGLLLARGKYIRLLADDDITYPEGMERAVALMDKHSEIDLLVCGGTKEYVKKIKKFQVYLPENVNYGAKPEDAIAYGASGAGQIMRRSVFAKAGIQLSAVINADVEFVMRCIARECVVRFARIHLYHHKIYSHSVLMLHKKQHREAMGQLIKQYCSTLSYMKYRMFGKTQPLPKYTNLEESVWDNGLS